MKSGPPLLVTGLLVCLLPSLAVACLWDYDTLLAERSRFPDTLELITGKFLRHSQEFYEWRVQDRLRKLEQEPENLGYLDDLAVAYDKLGKQDLAIEVMERKEAIKPGLYETAANHGTFHGHAGRLAEALPFLKRAIEINPDAHFGREKYQIHLYEYFLSTPGDKSFGEYLAELQGDFTLADRQVAIKGLLGIVRFGNQDNPKVLAALGSLLVSRGGENPQQDAKALAARAYLKASYLVKDPGEAQKLRKLAGQSISLQSELKLETVEEELKRELQDAETWYADLRKQELAWITAGADVEAEFAKLYENEPRALQTRAEPNLDHQTRKLRGELGLLGVVVSIPLLALGGLIAVGVVLIRRFLGDRKPGAR